MQLQWNQTDCAYMRPLLRECQNNEQTLEVKLPDGMPDVGRVLCAWGQPVLRSKQWRADGVSVAGGIQTWVLYEPENGDAPACMEAWIPFQMKWNLTDSRREGVVQVQCCLRSVDARSLSARKLLVRGAVGVMLEAMEPAKQPIYREGELPEGIQLLHRTYPMTLPSEAGEKLLQVEEHVTLPGSMGGKILCCQLFPQITEQTVVGSRAVFRGNCKVHMLYCTERGEIQRHTLQIPIAQYAELEGDYDKDAQVSVVMAVGSVEPELVEDQVHLRCELIGQYVVLDQKLLQVIEDAYSPWQAVEPAVEALDLPVVLDRASQTMTPQGQLQVPGRVLDVTFFPEQPVQYREADGLQSQVGGYFQVLYQDENGQLQCQSQPWNDQWELPVEENCQVVVRLGMVDPVQMGQGSHWETSLALEAQVLSGSSIPMLCGLEVGDKAEPDPGRPSLLLRRAGETSLWELAKHSGSTVDAIRKANHLAGEPTPGQMLLIPIA